jgi:hypothetical protein
LVLDILPDSIDRFKYIPIKDEFTQPQAQVYCSHFYKNGTLCAFKSDADWIQVLDSIDAEPNRQYWTNRVRTSSTIMANNAGRYLNNVNRYLQNEKQECSVVKYDNETKAIVVSQVSCREELYFICQTTDANTTIEGIA